jgi:hypothetical protein
VVRISYTIVGIVWLADSPLTEHSQCRRYRTEFRREISSDSAVRQCLLLSAVRREEGSERVLSSAVSQSFNATSRISTSILYNACVNAAFLPLSKSHINFPMYTYKSLFGCCPANSMLSSIARIVNNYTSPRLIQSTITRISIDHFASSRPSIVTSL